MASVIKVLDIWISLSPSDWNPELLAKLVFFLQNTEDEGFDSVIEKIKALRRVRKKILSPACI